MPAFLVPFMFVLDPPVWDCSSRLDQNARQRRLGLDRARNDHRRASIAALAGGVQGWLFRRTTWIERVMLIVAGLALVYPTTTADIVGLAVRRGRRDPAGRIRAARQPA